MDPVVETCYGRVSGTVSGGVHIFRGVPYGDAPIGRERFRAAGPPQPWTGVRKATRPGAVPVQAGVPRMTFLNAGGAARQSEKCLYLNVWAPARRGPKRPVLVWIHGGGFLIGSGSTPIYDGHGLARRGDLVVVTFNYRLGSLGYLHLNGIGGEEFAGASNAGLRDQIAALEWVKENIEQFGGDPDNVTVAGQSAGAMSIGALLGAPRARALFQRAILQSGAADNVLSQDEADEVASHFLRSLGGPPKTADTFARLSTDQLLDAQGIVNSELTSLKRLMAFQPCVDGDVIPEHPLEAIRRGAVRDMPIMVGTNLDEWKLFSPFDTGLPSLGEEELLEKMQDLLPQISGDGLRAEQAIESYRDAIRERQGDTSPFEVWSAFQSARIFHHPASVLAEAIHSASGRAFAYLFTWRPPAMRKVLGACHAMELPFLFGFTGHPAAIPFTGLSPAATRLSRRMQHAWINFVRSGDPNHEQLSDWPDYEVQARATMVFGRRTYVDHAPMEAERQLLESWT